MELGTSLADRSRNGMQEGKKGGLDHDQSPTRALPFILIVLAQGVTLSFSHLQIAGKNLHRQSGQAKVQVLFFEALRTTLSPSSATDVTLPSQ